MPIYDAQRNRLTNLRDSAGNLLARAWYTGGGSYELVYQRSAPYLFGQASVGDAIVAYLISGTVDAPTFTALANTLAAPSLAGDNQNTALRAAAMVAGQGYLSWERSPDRTLALQEISIDGGGITGGALYASSTGLQNPQYQGVFDHNGVPHGIDTFGRIYRLTTSGSTLTGTLVVQLFTTNVGIGATARTADGTLYLIAETPSAEIAVYRVSPTLTATLLAVSGDNVVVAGDIEAAIAIGDDLLMFGHNSRRIYRGVITSDAVAFTELTTQAPATLFFAAAKI